MGEVQLEVLKRIIKERFGIDIEFSHGGIAYRETIAAPVEGVGHYEPLRHYAEVHLLMEPTEKGSGMQFAVNCSEDSLDRNWQRLILTHLKEKAHIGVLTGSPITDMKITLIAGRAHQKHTEGGDFSQPETIGDMTRISGSAPVATMRDYQMDVTGYTHGKGRLNCILSGYEPCHNTEEVIAEIGYDSETDIENPADSVFCSHGAGFVVKWDKVYDHMHIDGIKLDQDDDEEENVYQRANDYINMVADDNELMQIFERTYGPVRRKVASYTVKKSTLCNYQGFKQCNLILVFDAYKVKGNVGSAEKIHNINVVYTKEAETADMYIEKITHEIGKKHRVRVATSDNLEQIIILGNGATRLSANELLQEVKLAEKTIMDIINSN